MTTAMHRSLLFVFVSLSIAGCTRKVDTEPKTPLTHSASDYTPPMAMSAETIQELATAATRTVFQDCENCPKMVIIPAGEFVMGSPPGEVTFVAGQGEPKTDSASYSNGAMNSIAESEPGNRFNIAVLIGRF